MSSINVFYKRYWPQQVRYFFWCRNRVLCFA